MSELVKLAAVLLALATEHPLLTAGVTLPAAAALLGTAALAIAIARDPGRATVPGWTPQDLAAFAAGPCPVCQGRHCAGCTMPARHMATWTRHTPRHTLADAPPSIMPGLVLMTPTQRARDLVRQLGQKHWHPYGRLPRRLQIRLRAATIARRHGLQPLLGQFGPRAGVRLP